MFLRNETFIKKELPIFKRIYEFLEDFAGF